MNQGMSFVYRPELHFGNWINHYLGNGYYMNLPAVNAADGNLLVDADFYEKFFVGLPQMHSHIRGLEIISDLDTDAQYDNLVSAFETLQQPATKRNGRVVVNPELIDKLAPLLILMHQETKQLKRQDPKIADFHKHVYSDRLASRTGLAACFILACAAMGYAIFHDSGNADKAPQTQQPTPQFIDRARESR